MADLWRRVGPEPPPSGCAASPGRDRGLRSQEPPFERKDMSTWRDRINEMMTELQQERDELRVKMSLGKAELREEMAELDGKLDDLRARAAEWADKADDQLDDVVTEAREKAADWLGDLKAGYQKLKDRMQDDGAPPPPM